MNDAPTEAALATRPVAGGDETADIVDLTEADAPQMLALAQLTEPDPFLARTHTMGHFLGIRTEVHVSVLGRIE